MIAVDILTGYLGAGKTTLLRHALRGGFGERRVAVIMNELGQVGIDGPTVSGLPGIERMVELNNGCLCCTIEEARFDRALQELATTAAADLIVIETTGAADPGPLAARIRDLGYGLDAVITVVDASNVATMRAADPVVDRQIAEADFVVMTKDDLVGPPERGHVARDLGAINPRARQLWARFGEVDSALLFATGAAQFRTADARGAAGTPSDLESFSFRSSGAIDLDSFDAVMAALPADVIRAKGLLRAAGRDAQCLFNYVNGRHERSWVRLPTLVQSQGVFIGPGVGRHAATVRAALAACERPTSAERETGASWAI